MGGKKRERPSNKAFMRETLPVSQRVRSVEHKAKETDKVPSEPKPKPKPKAKPIVTDSQVAIPTTEDELRDMVSSKSCPFMGITFKKGKWGASWHEKDYGQRMTYFPVSDYRTDEMTGDDASVEALRCAIRCRLVNSGSLPRIFKNPDKFAKEAESFPGVAWKASHKSWVTQRKFGGQWIWCKYFKPKDSSREAVQKARQEAIAYLTEKEALFWATQLSEKKRLAQVCQTKPAGPVSGFVSMTFEDYNKLPFAGASVVCTGEEGTVVGAEMINARLQYRVMFSDGDTCAMAPSEVEQFQIKH